MYTSQSLGWKIPKITWLKFHVFFHHFISQKRKAVGIPKSLMVAKLGNEQALMDAIRCGDVVEVQEIFG